MAAGDGSLKPDGERSPKRSDGRDDQNFNRYAKAVDCYCPGWVRGAGGIGCFRPEGWRRNRG